MIAENFIGPLDYIYHRTYNINNRAVRFAKQDAQSPNNFEG